MSKVEVNTVEPQCGTTLTLGGCGQTVALGSGASQTGFGRTGTVDWVTTPQTGTVTAATGKGYFVNTTAGTITVNLPVGAAGSIVSLADYARTWQTNNVTLAPNGSEKIGGETTDVVLNTEGQSVTVVYIDGTEGWVNVQDSTSAIGGPTYITATGGTPCVGEIIGDYKYHTFLGPGAFCVSAVGNPAGSSTVDYLVVAGGGGGGGEGGGGGAGGYRESPGTASGSYTVSPLGAAPAVALPVSVSPYTITVGGGGAGAPNDTTQAGTGNPSTFSSITSTGGGDGGTKNTPAPQYIGGPGGSGGGVGRDRNVSAGTGNTPSQTPPQGNPGGSTAAASGSGAGGGGGALVVGGAGLNGSPELGGPGGGGATSSINNTPTARAGGGGGGASPSTTPYSGSGGAGGGGAGGYNDGTSGTINTGGGGGGSGQGPGVGTGAGGSGIVIIRYKFQ